MFILIEFVSHYEEIAFIASQYKKTSLGNFSSVLLKQIFNFQVLNKHVRVFSPMNAWLLIIFYIANIIYKVLSFKLVKLQWPKYVTAWEGRKAQICYLCCSGRKQVQNKKCWTCNAG